jgi:hypothetical protein
MASVSPRLLASAAGQHLKATPVSDGRVTFELSNQTRPELFIADATAAGATLVSVNPLHTTLEEIFVQQVARTGSGREGAL